MVHSKSFYGAQLQRGKRLGTRWASRTSNPVSGSRQAGGGFDSHTLPPREGHGGMAKQERKGHGGGARRGRGRWTFGAGIGAGVVLALIVGWFAYRAQADLPGQKFADQGNQHVQTLGAPHEPYTSTPPPSGPPLPYIAPWGLHTRPIPN